MSVPTTGPTHIGTTYLSPVPWTRRRDRWGERLYLKTISTRITSTIASEP